MAIQPTPESLGDPLGRWLVMLCLWVGVSTSAHAQLTSGDVPTHEQMEDLIDPSILDDLGDLGDLPDITFDPENPDSFAGCQGDPTCEALISDLDLSTDPDLSDIDDILADAIPGSDPMSLIGSDIPLISEACSPGQDAVTEEMTRRFEYRCESGTNIQETENTCDLVLVHQINPDFIYECRVTQGDDGNLIISDECELLNGDPTCSLETSVCAEDSGAQDETISCRRGPANAATSPTCLRERVHELSLQFIYECEFVRNVSTGTFEPDADCQKILDAGGCRQGDQVCSDEREPQQSEETCETGDRLNYVTRKCDAPVQTIVDEDYIWTVYKDWNESRGEHVQSAEWTAANTARCEFLDESCAVPEPVVMEDQSCQIGHSIIRSTELCKIARRVTIDEDYKYAATRTWSAATQDHEPDVAWAALAASAGCQKIAESCQVETDPSYEIYSCEDGYRINTKPVSCYNRRVIEVDTDYLYKGYRNWNAGEGVHTPDATTFAAVGANCQKGAERCAVPSPGVFSEEICEVGYRIDYTDEAVVRSRIVTTDDDYVYEGKETWNLAQGRYVPDAARTTLVSQNPNCVQTSRTCTKTGPGVFSEYVCDAGYRDRYTKSACEVPRAITVDRDYRYQADRNFQYGPNRWNDTAQLSALKSASSCTKNGETCVTPSPGVFETLTCDIGTRTDYTDRHASRERVVVVDEDYIYDALRSWNGSYHQGNAAWQSLQTDASCELQSSVCSVTTPPPYTPYSCQSGYKDNESRPTCSRERTVTVDPDYVYTVNRSWNTSSNSWTGTSDWNAPRNARSNCSRIEATCAKASPGVYTTHTCEQGYSIDPENMSCRDELSFTVETDYQYYGYETWNGSSFVRDATLNAIWATSNNCSRTSVVNEQPWGDLRSEYTCVAGSITYSDEKTCNTSLTVNVSATTKKKYSATTGSPAQTYVHGRSGCVRKSTAGGRSNYECSSSQAYHGILSNSAKTILGYSYRIPTDTGQDMHFWSNPRCQFQQFRIRPNTGGGNWWERPPLTIDDEMDAIFSCTHSMSVTGATYLGRPNMTVYDHRVYLSSPGRTLLNGKTDCHHNSSNGSQGNFYCMSQYSLESLRSDGNQTYYSESDSWNTSACNGYSSSAYKGQVCIAGAATKNINGKSVYRSCWGYRRTYGTTLSRSVNSCSPPSGFSLQSSAAYNPSIGVSRSLQRRTYIKNHSRSDAASVVSNYDCFSGYWLDSNGTARWQSCSAPTGAIYVSNSCAFVDSAGTCRLRHYTYRVPAKAPVGGYSRKKETWVCNNRVYGSGVRSPSEVKKWKGWVWDSSQCNARRAAYPNGCTQTSASYVDSPRTKTIDGLSLTRQYTYQRNYSCQGKNVKNTCAAYASIEPSKPTQWASLDTDLSSVSSLDLPASSGVPDLGLDFVRPSSPGLSRSVPARAPPGKGKISGEDLQFKNPNAPILMAAVGDYEYVGQTCANYEGSTCTLWRKTYRREEHDPSGGCHIEQEKWRCENAISGAGSAAIVRDIVSETFPMTACNAMVAGQTSCTLIRQYQDTSTAGTRVINGLSVYRSFWAYKREYDCTKRVATETCSPPSGAVIHDVECLWKDSSNICRLVKRNYRIPLPDPTGGCTTFTDTYRCENRNRGTPKTTTHDIVSETFPKPAGYPSSSQGCTRKSYSYGPTQTRTINGLAVTRKWTLNEVFECASQTAVDTCNPLPAGSTQQGASTCVSANRDGSCGVSRKTYRYPVHDASGGCLRVREEYTCKDEVSAAGTPVAIPRSLDNETWNTSACSSYMSNSNCEMLEEACLEGPETRVIDGLPVYQACWKSRRQYECSTRETVNTCNPPSGATYDRQTCLWTDRQGSCRLLRKTYLKEEHDPSGGCDEYTSDFRCENTVAGLTPKQTITHHVADAVDPAPYNAVRANYDRCVGQRYSCVEGPEIRNINGLSVNRTCWAWSYEYECEKKTSVDSCTRKPGSTIENRECLWTDRSGACRLERHTVKVPEVDPSGGCHSLETTYTCEDQLSYGGGSSPVRGADLVGPGDWETPSPSRYVLSPGSPALFPYTTDAEWVTTTGPYGDSIDAIQAGQMDQGHPGGGGFTRYLSIDGSKTYEFTLYFKVSELDKHRVYFGLSGNRVLNSHHASPNNNPYFVWYHPSATYGHEANVWYLITGYVFPEGTPVHPWGTYGGVYDTRTGRKIHNVSNYIWSPDRAADDTLLRFFNYYETDRQGRFTTFYAPTLREVSANGIIGGGDILDVARDAGLLADETVEYTYTHFDTLKGVESNTIDRGECVAAIAGQGNCREVSTTCEGGNETRTIDGLAVSQSCWDYRVTYECSTTETFDTCEVPTDAIQDGTNCLWADNKGVCRLVEHIYKVPLPDPTEGCTVYQDQFLCEELVPPAAPIIETVKHVESIDWDNSACDALDFGDRTCRAEESCTQPGGTRTIDGVSVTESCWEKTRTYACQKTVPVNTCDVPDEAIRVLNECSERDDAGNCILFDRRYEWRVRDGSGGCHKIAQKVRCETDTVLSRTPEDYSYTLGVSSLQMGACKSITTPDPSCREVNRICKDAVPAERIPPLLVDGAGNPISVARPDQVGKVTRNCWDYEVEYQCEERTPVDTCSERNNDGCELRGQECLERDRDGKCVRTESTYDCDIDGTGGCFSQTTTFTCDVDTPPQSASNGASGQASFAEEKVFGGDNLLQTGPLKPRIPLPNEPHGTTSITSGFIEGIEPVDIIATVERAYWDNSACEAQDSFAGCELISTTCQDPGSGSGQAVRRAQDDFHTQYVGYAESVVEDCWSEQRTYECAASSGLTDCTDEADRCALDETTCLLTNPDGSCQLSESTYTCEAVACSPSRRICDTRRGKAGFEGYKYTCSNYTRSVEGYEGQQRIDCLGFATNCTRQLLSRTIFRSFEDGWREGVAVITRDDENRETLDEYAYYCPQPRTALPSTIQDHGYVKEAQDAETATCDSLDNETSCSLVAETCVTGRQLLYNDFDPNPIDFCTGETRKIYDCEQTDDGRTCSNECTAWDDVYSCENAVEGFPPREVVNPQIVSRVDASQCDALADNDSCILSNETCIEGPETRQLQGMDVQASCWRWQRIYTCGENTGFESNCELPNQNCELKEDICLSTGPDGTCLTTEHVYECTETEEHVISEAVGGTCDNEEGSEGGGGSDPYADPEEDNQPSGSSVFDVVAGLNSLGEGAADYQDEPKLFGGDALKCGKWIFGAKNCCKKSGLLIGLGCSENEERLAVARDNDLCISIGSYCSKKSFFGTCLKKKQSYCCYKSELARIVVETGREQAGKSLGTPKDPQCDGFSVQQFQLLDLSRADFSGVADNMLDGMNTNLLDMTPEQIRAALTARVQELQGGGG